jgi:Xaa-Pro aminopeptidase
MMDGRQEIYYAIGAHAELDQKIPCWIKAISSNARSGAQPPHAILSIEPLLHQMRLIKRAAEIRLMKRAANITADAHRHLMQKCRPGLAEYQLEGEFLYHCVQQGAREQAYPPIVASGVNACVLHYTGNSNILQDGDLLLIDAGCEYGYYASDVTRTIPINGRFSPEQRALYQLVLKAQYAAIAQICPGRRFNAAHDAAVEVLTQGLIKLKLLKGPTSKQIQKEGYKKYYMHKSSHWLGMDVHDVGSYKKHQQWCKLRPGMVLTIEPGIYIPPDDSSVPPQWRGIGIRIEDDLLVTPDGHEVLTKNAPKEIDEIEALMAHE